jgi:hypothetical protein
MEKIFKTAKMQSASCFLKKTMFLSDVLERKIEHVPRSFLLLDKWYGVPSTKPRGQPQEFLGEEDKVRMEQFVRATAQSFIVTLCCGAGDKSKAENDFYRRVGCPSLHLIGHWWDRSWPPVAPLYDQQPLIGLSWAPPSRDYVNGPSCTSLVPCGARSVASSTAQPPLPLLHCATSIALRCHAPILWETFFGAGRLRDNHPEEH